MKKGIKQLAAILILAGLSLTGGMSFAVEWEMMDRFSVDGYSEFRGTVAVPSGGFTVGGSTFAVQYGKIGIGTSTPSFLLHISTAAGVAGDLVVISTGDINVIRMTGAGEIYANKFNGDGSGLGMVVASSVAASGVRPGSIMPDVIVDADINTSAAILPTKIYGTAAVLGANTFTSSQTITGAGGLLATYGVSAATAAFTAQDASVPGVTISSGLIVSSGSVGIGTSSPSGKLSVKPAASDAFSLFISSQDGTTGNLVVAKSGYVGIGTTAPGYLLDINGNARIKGAGNYLYFDTIGGDAYNYITTANSYDLTLFAGRGSTSKISLTANSGLLFNTLSAERMRITETGNVGIGTTAPAYNLDVSGTLNAATIYQGGSSLASQYAPLSGGGNYIQLQAATPGAQQAGHLNISGTGLFGGNVGIGTMAPTARLEVHDGNDSIALYRLADNQLAIQTLLDGQSLSGYNYGGGQNQLLLQPLVGSVGIGTTAPGYGLEVIKAAGVHLSTTATAGYGLYLNTAGNVGIGTAGPVAKLNIALSGTTAAKNTVAAFGAGGIVQLSNTIGTNTGDEIGFFGSNGTPLGQIAAGFGFLRENAGNWATALKFYTHSPSTSVIDEIIERMRIDSAGNVGIGTTDPRGKLDVSGTVFIADGNQLQIGVSGTSGLQLIGQTGTQALVGSMGAEPLIFRTASVERARINASGNVGIGTTSPGAKLDVGTTNIATDEEGTFRLGVAGTIAGEYYTFGRKSTTGDLVLRGYQDGVSGFRFFTKTTTDQERLTILNNGNVGIGTAAPGALLQVGTGINRAEIARADSRHYFEAQNDVGTNAFEIYVQHGSSATRGFFNVKSNVGGTGVSHLYVHGNGNVGIGTTAPGALFNVKNPAGDLATRFEGFTNAYKSKMYLSSVSSGDGGLQYDSNSNQTDIFSYGDIKFNAGTGNISGAVANERMRITQSGNVGIGTTAPGYGLEVVNAAGVRFSTTATAGYGLYLNSAGNVGIGTTGPGYTLDVKGPDTDNTVIARFYSNSGNRGTFGIRNGAATNPTTFIGTLGGSEQLAIGTVNAEVIRITAGGNVGIGTTAPRKRLEVTNDSSNFIAYFNSVNGVNVGIYSDTTVGWVGTTTSNRMLFGANGGTHMLINTDGNVGIGTYDPAARLHVYDTNVSSPTTMRVRTPSGNEVVVSTGGNVGIGTTAPADRFHVAGESRLQPSSGSGYGRSQIIPLVSVKSAYGYNVWGNYFTPPLYTSGEITIGAVNASAAYGYMAKLYWSFSGTDRMFLAEEKLGATKLDWRLNGDTIQVMDTYNYDTQIVGYVTYLKQ